MFICAVNLQRLVVLGPLFDSECPDLEGSPFPGISVPSYMLPLRHFYTVSFHLIVYPVIVLKKLCMHIQLGGLLIMSRQAFII